MARFWFHKRDHGAFHGEDIVDIWQNRTSTEFNPHLRYDGGRHSPAFVLEGLMFGDYKTRIVFLGQDLNGRGDGADGSAGRMTGGHVARVTFLGYVEGEGWRSALTISGLDIPARKLQSLMSNADPYSWDHAIGKLLRSGNDRILLNNMSGGADGGAGNDTIIGASLNETLEGGRGDDRLIGARGHDRLDGGYGNDVLDPGPGHNELLGGAGADQFLYRAGDGISNYNSQYDDVIWDFVPGEDKIVFDVVNAHPSFRRHVAFDGYGEAGVKIELHTLHGHKAIILADVKWEDLGKDDFVFI
ncbi:calcium-binding protein [Gemmobacter caeruleus]|uniref:calcium-binding protein n=1 Tax=Gemmobacter caeruleus TaxID=2595004 RepID=UPI0011EBEF83|nr:calcium-binding protein [Gemmobacter caeruleus]